MKKLFMVLPLVLMLCFAFGCQKAEEVAEEPAVDVEAEKEVIRKLTTEWFDAELRRDMEACLSNFAPDAVLHVEGATAIVGISGIRAGYEEFFKLPFTDWVMEPRTVFVSKSGDLAYDFGSFKMVIEDSEGRTEVPSKNTIIWRKLEGQWKCVVITGTNDTPPSQPSE